MVSKGERVRVILGRTIDRNAVAVRQELARRSVGSMVAVSSVVVGSPSTASTAMHHAATAAHVSAAAHVSVGSHHHAVPVAA